MPIENPATDPSRSDAPSRRTRTFYWLAVTVTVIAVVWLLRATAVVAVPLAFSFFIALAVAPVDDWVQRRMPRRLKSVGHLAAMALIFMILAIFFGCLWISAQRVAAQMPNLSDQFASANIMSSDNLLPSVSTSTGEAGADNASPSLFGPATEAASGTDPSQQGGSDQSGKLSQFLSSLGGAGRQVGGAIAGYVSNAAMTILSSATSILGSMVLILSFTLLMLIERPVWREKLSSISGEAHERTWFETIEIIATKFRWYLLIRSVLGVITAALYVGWIWIFGLDLLIVWGLLAFLLNFIPTLGSLIAGALPVLYALFQKDFATAAMIAAGLLVIEQVMGNYVDPRVQGRQLSLSSLIVLIALVIWGWLWGLAGALLAVPMTIVFLVVGSHVPSLRRMALLLSDTRSLKELVRATKR